MNDSCEHNLAYYVNYDGIWNYFCISCVNCGTVLETTLLNTIGPRTKLHPIEVYEDMINEIGKISCIRCRWKKYKELKVRPDRVNEASFGTDVCWKCLSLEIVGSSKE